MKKFAAYALVLVTLLFGSAPSLAGEANLRGGALFGTAGVERGSASVATKNTGYYLGGDVEATAFPLKIFGSYGVFNPNSVGLTGLGQVDMDAMASSAQLLAGYNFGPATLGAGWASTVVAIASPTVGDSAFTVAGPTLGIHGSVAASQRLSLGGELYYAPNAVVTVHNSGLSLQAGRSNMLGAELRGSFRLVKGAAIESGYRLSQVQGPQGLNLNVSGYFVGGRYSF